MKKLFPILFIALLSVLLVGTTALAQVTSGSWGDDFTSYTVGSPLYTDGGWVRSSTSIPSDSIQNATPLTYSGYSWGGGNYVEFPAGNGSTGRVYKVWPYPDSSYNNSYIYYSLLLNISKAGPKKFYPANNTVGSNAYFLSLGQQGNQTNYLGKLFADSSGTGGYRLGISKIASNDSAVTFNGTDLSFNTTYLIVVLYAVGGPNDGGGSTDASNDDDAMYVWINPSGSGEPDQGSADCAVTPGSNNGDYDCDTYNVLTGGIGNFLSHSRGANTPVGFFDAVRVGWATTSSADAWTQLAPGPLPVELTAFNATVSGKSVNLAWRTATEVNNSGFEVERNAAGTWTQVGFVAGNGTSNSPHNYSYVDAVAAGNYSYRLKQIDHNGAFVYSKTIQAAVGLSPSDYALSQNYPNPFNPTTMITFAVKTDQKASMKVYNMLGQEVMTLFDGDAKANQLYQVQFNASSLASGAYFYILQTADSRQVKKMLLLK